MRKLFLWLSICTAGVAQAQKIPDPRPFAKTITADDLKKHLYIVASKDFEGRETATEGQRKAAAYIENDFRNLGLQPGNGSDYQLYYPVFQDSLESAGLTVGNQSFELDKDFFVNVGANYSAELLGSDVVFAGYGISDNNRDDYKGLDVKGKIVLVLGGQPAGSTQPAGRRGSAFYAKQDAAQSHGAAAVLILQSNLPRAFFGAKGNMYLNEFRKTIYPNSFYITEKAGAGHPWR
ncbi:PA domain-containing protein [Puia sp. P3]|uniref:PA domain-containing protein n=1 Tax=Puia sp. P3 TaxID=3423952 RepID=UPI003D666F06